MDWDGWMEGTDSGILLIVPSHLHATTGGRGRGPSADGHGATDDVRGGFGGADAGNGDCGMSHRRRMNMPSQPVAALSVCHPRFLLSRLRTPVRPISPSLLCFSSTVPEKCQFEKRRKRKPGPTRCPLLSAQCPPTGSRQDVPVHPRGFQHPLPLTGRPLASLFGGCDSDAQNHASDGSR